VRSLCPTRQSATCRASPELALGKQPFNSLAPTFRGKCSDGWKASCGHSTRKRWMAAQAEHLPVVTRLRKAAQPLKPTAEVVKGCDAERCQGEFVRSRT